MAQTDHELIRNVIMAIREHVVDDLLAGNDLCCFSTKQYMDRYSEVLDKASGYLQPSFGLIDHSVARTHLQSLSHIREVKQDLWTPTESAAFDCER